MAYVEAHAGLRDHLKTKKVARLLGIPRTQVIGHMLCLWWWCQEYAQDGNLSNFETGDIADAADWEGDAETFVNALLMCGPRDGVGFLARDDDGDLVVNDWFQYGGKLFVKREQSAGRMRNMRERNKAVTQELRVTSASVTHIDKIIDKKRKDKIDKIKETPPDGDSSPQPQPKADVTTQQEVFGALAVVCLLDEKLKAKVLGKTASQLAAAGYTADQVKDFGVWWAHNDWRGQKGATPTLAQVTDGIRQSTTNPALMERKNGNGNGKPTAAPQRQDDYTSNYLASLDAKWGG